MTPGSAGRPHLSVVVPAYKEEERLALSLPAILAYLEEGKIESEVLVVDDGSEDDTSRVAEELLKPARGRVMRLPVNGGKGAAVRDGVLAARGSWILLTDADLSTPIEEHRTLATTALDHDVDVVIGSRGLPGSRVEVHQNPLREVPVIWRNDPRSAVSLVGDSIRMLRDLARIRWTYRRGGYRP